MDRNRYPRRYSHTCGQSIRQGNLPDQGDNCICKGQPIALAMSYVKVQPLGELYSPLEGLKRGTIFALLNKPYCAGGNRR